MSKNIDKNKIIKDALIKDVLDIDTVIECNDFETIKFALNNYPLSVNELIKDKYKSGDVRYVFERAIDNECKEIANYIVKYKKEERSQKEFDRMLDDFIAYNKAHGVKGINDKYFYTKRGMGYSRVYLDVTKEEVINKILTELSLKIDKETLTQGLTYEYFQELFNNKNYELLIIKLCVRLEAILKCDFHYTGTFDEMLKSYASEHGYEHYYDNDDNLYNEETPQIKIFYKLKKCRNGLVHAEKNQDTLTDEELSLAIKYVCELG